MFKKSLVALSLIVATVSFASDNDKNNNKKEFKGTFTPTGPIYTGNEGRQYTQNNVNAQWGNNPQPKKEQTYSVQGYRIVSNQGSNQGSNDCIIS